MSTPSMVFNIQWYLQFGFNVFSFLFTAGVAYYVRRATRREKVDLRLAAIEEDLSSRPKTTDCSKHRTRTGLLETRTAEMRIELSHMPTQSQLNDLSDSISALNGELKKTIGRLEGINRVADLMNEFLINQGGAEKR